MRRSEPHVTTGVTLKRLAMAIVGLSIAIIGLLAALLVLDGREAEARCEECGQNAPSSQPLVADVSLPSPEGEEDGSEEEKEPSQNLCSAVPEMVQYPEMPAGCEVYSLAAVLSSIGFEADPHALVAEHLSFSPVDGTAASAYSGDPHISGEGLPPAIVAAGNSFLKEAGAKARLSDATGSSFESLERTANEGTPVLVWTTMWLQDPGFASPLPPYTFYPLEHCLVLLGSDLENARTMDPMTGFVSYDREWLQYVFEQCGSMAIVLEA